MNDCTCGRPLSGGAICSGCSKALEIAIGNISSYWCDLDTVKARQTRYGVAGGRFGAEKALPVDLRFLDVSGDGTILQDAAKNTVATWTRTVLDGRPAIHGPTHPACLHITCNQARRSHTPADNVAACCRYLLGQVDWIRNQDWAPDMLDELDDLENQLRRVVDRPADREFMGPCDECREDLYARPGASSMDCRWCGRSHDLTERRAWLWEQALDMLATAAECARAISGHNGTPLNDATIRKWVERKRLTAKGTQIVRGRLLPTYRVGDVAALVESMNQQKAG